ncbi:hypothetical protein Plim_3115 [Planctopirus limnophila DSM 3776]|uniref:Uncharacterized protein n=1 Tax=Planctopirus limnophila (strain ATCC 43296 / DSM 3776 / IFAM 1008 / Mu 290) TaxID=521674 RepID=D5SSX9_PLAL2|nr:hypothetical protein [Planctopirus limnophila]ADG68930.1 hypothetical protein Plim_3115 [Planctopirus limnophila DSM 3776]
MAQQLARRKARRSQGQVVSNRPEWVTADWLDDVSSFGLQAFLRQPLTILKADAIQTLAVALALRGNRKQIRDPQFVNHVLSRNPQLVEEYRIVHLIEKSLWIQGHSDLVMTMVRNPSQIPDNPPALVMDAVTRAYQQHPDSTVWFGVPLFSDRVNQDGLPIPVTAEEVQLEAQKRIQSAQKQALRYGWLFKLVAGVLAIPLMSWAAVQAVATIVENMLNGIKKSWQIARRDARQRLRAMAKAEIEQCRYGCSFTKIPEHTTRLGQSMETGAEALLTLENFAKAYTPTFLAGLAPGGLVMPVMLLAKLLPLLTTPAVIITADPFLFIELPEEPGKLRHLAHWYWQGETYGQQRLHLHV